MAMGRPRKVASADEAYQRIETYVEECEAAERPITMTGMAMAFGFAERQSLNYYASKEGDELFAPIKWAIMIVQRSYEERLYAGAGAGPIFALKNMGWSDKQEYEHSGPNGGPVQVAVDGPKRLTIDEWNERTD